MKMPLPPSPESVIQKGFPEILLIENSYGIVAFNFEKQKKGERFQQQVEVEEMAEEVEA